MSILALTGAAVMAVLGLLHLVYTIYDCAGSPRYFSPQDRTLLDSMRQTHTALAPNGANYWFAVLGFNLSHSLGVIFFALLIAIATIYSIAWLKPPLVIGAVSYAVISYLCWFRIPTTGIVIALVLMLCGWLL